MGLTVAGMIWDCFKRPWWSRRKRSFTLDFKRLVKVLRVKQLKIHLHFNTLLPKATKFRDNYIRTIHNLCETITKISFNPLTWNWRFEFEPVFIPPGLNGFNSDSDFDCELLVSGIFFDQFSAWSYLRLFWVEVWLVSFRSKNFIIFFCFIQIKMLFNHNHFFRQTKMLIN